MTKKSFNHLLKNLPQKPGVYRFKDRKGEIIYIGKAVNLKNRVSSYFKNRDNNSVKTQKMVSQIDDIDCTVVGSDLEAVLLETNLIKEYKPKYNILMKDDKNFVYLKITVNEDFPRIFITRKVEKDGAMYFGPKTARFKLEKTLKILKKIFPYRHCQLDIEYNGKSTEQKNNVTVKKAVIKYPCIDYHIKRCAAPCIGLVSPGEYRKIIDHIIDFFKGNYDPLIKNLKEDMQKAAAEKKFELAASIRDKLSAIEDILEKQSITAPDHRNLDVVNFVSSADGGFFFNLFQVHEGKLINQENFRLAGKEKDEYDGDEALANFIQQYYEKTSDLPDEILIPREINQKEIFEAWLSRIKGRKIKFLIPQKGRKDKLLELCLQNAANYAKLSEIKWQGDIKSARDKALEECAKLLKLERPPRRIECYDISHIGGTQTTASMVVFKKGFPAKDDYRKFKLHINVSGAPDDYAYMEEVLSRRLKHLKTLSGTLKTKLARPRKKELEQYLKKQKINDPASKIILKMTSGKNPPVYLEIAGHEEKRFLFENRSDIKREDMPEMFQKLFKFLKTRKIYLWSAQNETAAWEQLGFETVKKVHPSFPERKEGVYMLLLSAKLRTDSSLREKPDLVVIDGGKGQLNVAVKVLKNFKSDIPCISIAKKNEEIYLPGNLKPVIYPKDHPLLHLIQHLRDESHRFAVSYQQNLKLKANVRSELDDIFGVGDSLKLKLLNHFGSVRGVKSATLHELEMVVGKKNALKIKSALL